MSIDEAIADELARHDGFVSGESLAASLGVTRAAVWKAVDGLRQQGAQIEAVRNRGYRLASPCDVMGVNAMSRELGRLGVDVEIEFHERIGSTNDRAKEHARDGGTQYHVVVAGEQMAGRGRRGKGFFSPAGCGVYLSLLVPARDIPANPQVLTAAAAVSTCRALETVTEHPFDIKWINDVYRGGRKVCGILTEAEIDLETGMPAWAVVGIGINVYEPAGGWPEEIKDKAGSALGTVKQGTRSLLAARTVAQMCNALNSRDEAGVLAEYRRRSNLIGRDVQIAQADEQPRLMRVVGINDELHLLARPSAEEDAPVEEFSSAEVSIALL